MSFNLMGNNQVGTVLTDQTVKTMGGAHLSPNPNHAMDKNPLVSHTHKGLVPMRMNCVIESTIYPYEWTGFVGHG